MIQSHTDQINEENPISILHKGRVALIKASELSRFEKKHLAISAVSIGVSVFSLIISVITLVSQFQFFDPLRH